MKWLVFSKIALAIVCYEEQKLYSTNSYSDYSDHQNPEIVNLTLIQTGFHATLRVQCKNFNDYTDIKQVFPKSVFVDLDKIKRDITDPVSTLYDVKLCADRYPVDIENPAWLETSFHLVFTCKKELEFDIPLGFRYHAADLRDKYYNLQLTSSNFKTFSSKIATTSAFESTQVFIPIGDLSQRELVLGGAV